MRTNCRAYAAEAAAELAMPVQINTLISQETVEDLPTIYELLKTLKVARTIEAPSYRRVALNRMREEGSSPAEIRGTSMYRGFEIRDGHGIVFVSNLVDVYRNAPMFRELHAPDRFKGKCARCEYRIICGGSRSRAFALTGDPLASDPFCPYEPERAAGSTEWTGSLSRGGRTGSARYPDGGKKVAAATRIFQKANASTSGKPEVNADVFQACLPSKTKT